MIQVLLKLLAVLRAQVFNALVTAIVEALRDALIDLVERLIAQRRGGACAA